MSNGSESRVFNLPLPFFYSRDTSVTLIFYTPFQENLYNWVGDIENGVTLRLCTNGMLSQI